VVSPGNKGPTQDDVKLSKQDEAYLARVLALITPKLKKMAVAAIASVKRYFKDSIQG
jgi:hypothetical protein